MRKYLAIGLLFLIGCQPLEVSARDGIVTASAIIKAKQSKWRVTCQANPSVTECQNINKAGAALNVAIDALNAYCTSDAFNNNIGPCEPKAAFTVKLKNALSDLNRIKKDVEGL